MGILTQKLGHTDRQVQETACSSLQLTFQQTDPDKLKIICKEIFEMIASVMTVYKGVQLVALLDCTATLAEVMQERIRT